MATISHGDRFEIFKFKETGLVALCQEVTELVTLGGIEHFRVDLSTARYEQDPDNGIHRVIFDYLPEEKTP